MRLKYAEQLEVQQLYGELRAEGGEGDGIPLHYSAWKVPWTEDPRLQSMTA